VISDGVGIIDSGRNYVVINTREWKGQGWKGQEDWDEAIMIAGKDICAAWDASRGQSESRSKGSGRKAVELWHCTIAKAAGGKDLVSTL
jgi:hypothetical protein